MNEGKHILEIHEFNQILTNLVKFPVVNDLWSPAKLFQKNIELFLLPSSQENNIAKFESILRKNRLFLSSFLSNPVSLLTHNQNFVIYWTNVVYFSQKMREAEEKSSKEQQMEFRFLDSDKLHFQKISSTRASSCLTCTISTNLLRWSCSRRLSNKCRSILDCQEDSSLFCCTTMAEKLSPVH